MIRHSPFVRKLTYLIGVGGIVLGVLFILFLLAYKAWVLPDPLSCDTWLPEVIYPQEIKGKVVAITPQSDCVKILNIAGFGEIRWCVCSTSSALVSNIDIGDSLHKPLNSLSITICSPLDACATLYFPCCD